MTRARFERSHWAQPVAVYRQPPATVWQVLGALLQCLSVLAVGAFFIWALAQ